MASIQYKVKLIKEELENINHAIHWAKAGIINSLIHSENEIQLSISAWIKRRFHFKR